MKNLKNFPGKFNLYGFMTALTIVFVAGVFMFSHTVSAHCDSYDGPVIKDAQKALETQNPDLLLKWIHESQEAEVLTLFHKTSALKEGDGEIYNIVEQHFLETLVRLHRETEGAPYTGLKPAGTTKPIINLTDRAMLDGDIDGLIARINDKTAEIIREKHEKATLLHAVKDESVEQGRAYVEAYVDYTHSIEALHDLLDHIHEGIEHSH